MGTITLITGGARSGKSAWALKRGETATWEKRIFVATAELLDNEMKERAHNHQKERSSMWQTIEEPRDLAGTISTLPDYALALIDCCTVWLGNIWHTYGNDGLTLEPYVHELVTALECWRNQKSGEIILVSNEVGWGIVPHGEGVRRYRDWAGKLNQGIAAIAEDVYLCVAGIALPIKTKKG